MLQKLLELIRSGGTFEVRSLAMQLGTTPELVLMMLEHLEHLDVVKAKTNCDNGCDHCGLKLDCKVGNMKLQNSHVWEMVELLQ